MESWKGKVALVTGASSGIGKAIAVRLADEGIRVVAVGRRHERLQELAESRSDERILPMACDVTKETDYVNVFRTAEKKLGPVQILVNNAGTALRTQVSECETDKWRNMFELNVIALGVGMREMTASLSKHGIAEGYIINIGSISGHGMPELTGKHVYNATKHAVRVITEGMRQELARNNSKVKVSTISPGVVTTEIFDVGGWKEAMPLASNSVPQLPPEEIAQVTVDLLSTSPNTHIADVIVRPLGEKIMA